MAGLQIGEKRQLDVFTSAKRFSVKVKHDLAGLDISLFGLNADRQLSDDRYFIFYNQLHSPAGELSAVLEAYEASFQVDLELLPPHIQRLMFVATHDEQPVGAARRLTWELAGVPFKPLEYLRAERAVIMAEIYQHGGMWRVGAVGQGFEGGLQALLESFGGQVAEERPQEDATPALWDGTPWQALSAVPGDPERGPQTGEQRCRRCSRPDQDINRIDPVHSRCASCQAEVQRARHEFRQAFLQAAFSQDLTAAQWNRLVEWARERQLSGRRLLEYIRSDAAHVLNRAVTLAAQDGVLSEDEELYLSAMMDAFDLPPALTYSANKTMTDLRAAQHIRTGQLQTVQTSFALQPGDLCYADVPVDFHRIMARGARILPGRLLVTNRQLIFSGQETSYAIRYKNILNLDEHQSGIYLQLAVKQGSGFYSTTEARTLAATIQTMLDVERRQIYLASSDSGQQSRRIARHIQNQVYSRDQGKCVECGSRTELQFDHIVPYSRGGSNEAANIQLLCRSCNLAKSNRF